MSQFHGRGFVGRVIVRVRRLPHIRTIRRLEVTFRIATRFVVRWLKSLPANYAWAMVARWTEMLSRVNVRMLCELAHAM